MRNTQVFIFASLLCAVGLAIFAYKTIVVGFPMLPGEKADAWEIDVKVEFTGESGPAKVDIFLPPDRLGLQVFDSTIIAKGYGVSRSEAGPNRRISLATRQADGHQVLFMRFIAHRFAARPEDDPDPRPKVTPAKLDEASLAAAQALIARAQAQSADGQTFVTALLKAMLEEQRKGSNVNAAAERADMAVAVLSTALIPARRVNGIDLGARQKHVKIVTWIEVYDEDEWKAYSIETGEHGVPHEYMPWWYGKQPLVAINGGSAMTRSVSFNRLQELTLDKIIAEGRDTGSEVVTLSLFSLPLSTQAVYRVLTVVPLGIFILVIIRNVVGLRTLGTFMPVLIALAFRETKLVWGLFLFTSVVGAGLLFRAYLEHLKLLLVPRLASVLIFVVLFMAALSVVSARLGLEGGLSVALFPMVILTMTIERVSVIWDELGPNAALKQAGASLLVAALCYLVMSNEFVQHLFFTFPELLLVLLAGTLLLGRYSGYRLLELPRFRVLAGD